MPELRNSTITLLSRNVVLTAAQIQQLNTTPQQLIPAPGVGFTIVAIELVAVMAPGSQIFATTAADSLSFPFTGTSGLAFAAAVSGFVASTLARVTSKLGTALTAAAYGVAAGVDNQAINVTSAGNYNAGPIVTATLGAGGTGYAVNDTGTITQGINDATYIITSIGAGGAVTGFTITAPGTKYSVANGVATATGGAQPGVGINFTVNITAVNAGNGTLRLIPYYVIVPTP